MPTTTYRANLSSAVFPMTLADAGRTVINPGVDQNFDRRVDPAGEQKDAGIPQAIYMENVLPTVNGYQSVGYIPRTVLPGKSAGSGAVSVKQVFVLPVYIRQSIVIAAREGTAGYDDTIFNTLTPSGSWNYQTGATVPQNITGEYHSVANVRGVTYWADGTDLFTLTYDTFLNQVSFTNISGTLTGLLATEIKYICSAYNYLIVLKTDDTIAWSSTTTPTDFTPSLVTGAGSETPAGAFNPNFLVQHPDGFYIYCNNSVVFAQYTGNARYPWKFVPVANAGGYDNPQQVSGAYTSGVQYGIDNSRKIQIISGKEAQLVAPEISTFLERKNYKDTFDLGANTFSRVTGTIFTSLSFLLDRYIVVSLSYTNSLPYEYAIVYDTLLQRYGILKITHVCVVSGDKDILFIPSEANATPYNLSFNIYDNTATFNGALLLGKFQFIRDRHLQLEEIEIESAQDSTYITRNFSLLNFRSLDGKNFLTPDSLTPTYSGNLITAKTHKTALNHSLMLKGAFDVNTLQLKFRVAGER